MTGFFQRDYCITGTYDELRIETGGKSNGQDTDRIG